MLYYDKIDVSRETYVNKTSASKECEIYHYWYFLNKGFMFQPYVCNKYHNLLMISLDLINIAILKIKNTNYHCIIAAISKIEAIK